MSGLYIHVPFCRTKCGYCDFYSMPPRGREEAFADAVISEFTARRREIASPYLTIYFGGGTPSSMPVHLLRRIVSVLPVESVVEMTIEANPEDVDAEWVDAVVDMGFNRVSMGVQSLDDDSLRMMGRRHSSRQAIDAIACLRAGGIHNISCDLIYGLPGQTIESWRSSLEGLLSTGVPHLSAYILSFEPGTRFSAMLGTGRLHQADDADVERMYDILCSSTRGAGMVHYEISNFALPGMESRHNSSYWDGTPYLGLGPGAHSFDGQVRRFNPSDLRAYVAAHGLITETESMSPDSRHNDRVITGLRTARGLTAEGFTEAEMERVARLIGSGVLEDAGPGRFRIPEAGWLMADSTMLNFIRV